MSAPIFVFGSNLAGRHGKGAALFARKHHGAIYGQGGGRQGNSYGIPTKDERIRVLPIDVIALHVAAFVEYAKAHPELEFEVTKVGCGYAGYREGAIKPLFKDAPPNCHLPEGWRDTPFPVMHPMQRQSHLPVSA